MNNTNANILRPQRDLNQKRKQKAEFFSRKTIHLFHWFMKRLIMGRWIGYKEKVERKKKKKENQIRQSSAEFYVTNQAKERMKRSRKVWRKCLIIQTPSSKEKSNILLFFCLIYAVPGLALVCSSTNATTRKIAR